MRLFRTLPARIRGYLPTGPPDLLPPVNVSVQTFARCIDDNILQTRCASEPAGQPFRGMAPSGACCLFATYCAGTVDSDHVSSSAAAGRRRRISAGSRRDDVLFMLFLSRGFRCAGPKGVRSRSGSEPGVSPACPYRSDQGCCAEQFACADTSPLTACPASGDQSIFIHASGRSRPRLEFVNGTEQWLTACCGIASAVRPLSVASSFAFPLFVLQLSVSENPQLSDTISRCSSSITTTTQPPHRKSELRSLKSSSRGKVIISIPLSRNVSTFRRSI